ncbi:MAG: hypothetical protein SGI77_03255 [Pirellulaceae bacterium]|nr:hypothetical protein [Pirellulaceae bacterium]
MPKKKKSTPSGQNEPAKRKTIKPDPSGRTEGRQDEIEIAKIREMFPQEFECISNDQLAAMWKKIQTEEGDRILSDVDDILDGESGSFDDEDDLFDNDDDWTEELEDLTREAAPAGFFEALDALDEIAIADIDDPKECSLLVDSIIKACPQCGDAWLTLAIFEPSVERAKEHLFRALEESRWMLGAASKEPMLEESMFRSFIVTGLDVCAELWKRGLRADALEVHSELLNVSPEDIGGQRLLYAYRLLEHGWSDELDEQLAALAIDTQSQAGLRLLEALHLYSKDKDGPTARQALLDSHESNPLIAQFVLGDRDWEDLSNEDESNPEEDEAHWVAYTAIAAVRSIEGFSRWMRDTLNYTPMNPVSSEPPHRQRLEEIQDLEQNSDDWILGSRTLDGDSYYTAIYVPETEQLVGILCDDTKPSTKRLWEIFTDAILNPDFGEPIRPSRLFVDRPSLATTWKKRCQRMGIECLFDSDFSVPDDLFAGLHETIQRVENQVSLSDATIAAVRDLPMSDEIWHVGVFHPPIWITDSATPRKSSVALVIDEETELIRIHDLTDGKPSTDFLAQTVLKGMLYPFAPGQEPCRPAEIKVHPASNPDALEKLAESLDIEVSMADATLLLDDAIEHLIQHCSDASMRISLRESAQADDRELTRLYQNIARFYRAALWRSISCDQIVQISSEEEDLGTFYAVIIGQMGQHRGLVICEDRKPIDDIVTGRATTNDDEVTVLNFSEAHEIAPIDLWLIEQMDLEIAGEDAYPLLQRSLSKQRFRRPTRSELLTVDVVMRCLPAFAEQPMLDEVVSQTVSTFLGPISVSLKWTVPS